ncbi:MAG TPA: hypothetical protein VJS11_00195 [Acidobacteriaceae bacterium]|nr:hypothetical protein [Acidobacteriaceae bacterium]
MRLALRSTVWACALAAGGSLAFLISAWFFPKLSDSVHSRVSAKTSVDDQAYRLTQVEEAYLRETSACHDPERFFEACRAALLTAEPTLNRLELTVDSIARAWQQQIMENSMSAACERAGSDEYLAWSDYVSAQRRLMALLKPLDPSFPASRTVFTEQLQPIAASEAASAQRVNSLPPWPMECARYWPAAHIQPTFRNSAAIRW